VLAPKELKLFCKHRLKEKSSSYSSTIHFDGRAFIRCWSAFATILGLQHHELFLDLEEFLPDVPSLRSLIKILEVVSEVSILLQGNYPTMCLAACSLSNMMNEIRKLEAIPTKCAAFAKRLLSHLNSRFSAELSSPSLMLRCSLLMPKSSIPSFFTRELWTDTWKALAADLESLLPDEEEIEPSLQVVHDPDSLLGLLPQGIPVATARQTAHRKMLEVLEHFRLNWTSFGNFIKPSEVIEFWKSPPSQLLQIQPLAMMMLSVPASSAASESIASIMGRIKTIRAANMSPSRLILETSVCLNHTLFRDVRELLAAAAFSLPSNQERESSDSEIDSEIES